MKKLVLSITLVLAMGLSLTSCRDTENKADDAGDAVEKAADKSEGALEKAGKAIDNATKEVKEAGQAIDSAAKEITDDN